MWKFLKKFNIALAFMLMAIFLCQEAGFCLPAPEPTLRPPLKFNWLEPSHRIISELTEEIGKHIESFGEWHEKVMPEIEIVEIDNGIRHEYIEEEGQEKIYIYVSRDSSESEFRRQCLYAFGDWFMQNEAAWHGHRDYVEWAWDNENLPNVEQYMEEMLFIRPYEIKGKIILDIGSGPGMPGILLAEEGAKKVVCVDDSAFLLAEGKKIAKEKDLNNIEFVKDSAFKLPFEDDSFDMVFARFMIYRLPGGLRGLALAEVLRVLKPRGIFKLFNGHGAFAGFFIKSGDVLELREQLDELRKIGFVKAEILYLDIRKDEQFKGVYYTIKAEKATSSPHFIRNLIARIRIGFSRL